jgi:serine/threonine protein kinase
LGVTLGDLSLNNLLLVLSPEGLVKLADIGSARSMPEEEITRAYARARELWLGEHVVAPSIDLWRVGVVALALLPVSCLFG